MELCLKVILNITLLQHSVIIHLHFFKCKPTKMQAPQATNWWNQEAKNQQTLEIELFLLSFLCLLFMLKEIAIFKSMQHVWFMSFFGLCFGRQGLLWVFFYFHSFSTTKIKTFITTRILCRIPEMFKLLLKFHKIKSLWKSIKSNSMWPHNYLRHIKWSSPQISKSNAFFVFVVCMITCSRKTERKKIIKEMSF